MQDEPENEEQEFEEFEGMEVSANYIEVPVQFHSFMEEGPFSKCTLCEESLLEDGTQYLIHKAFHREEVIFEYAMCLPCRAKMQEELESATVESSAGGGAVKAVVSGKMKLESLEIDPEAVSPDDVEMLQDLVLAAVNEGMEKAQEMVSSRMSSLTGGMKIPGLM